MCGGACCPQGWPISKRGKKRTTAPGGGRCDVTGAGPGAEEAVARAAHHVRRSRTDVPGIPPQCYAWRRAVPIGSEHRRPAKEHLHPRPQKNPKLQIRPVGCAEHVSRCVGRPGLAFPRFSQPAHLLVWRMSITLLTSVEPCETTSGNWRTYHLCKHFRDQGLG